MSTARQDMVGLIELVDADALLDRHGKYALVDLQQVFSRRLQKWLRPRDEWRKLDDNHVYVTLRGVSTPGELAMATAKLERLFREPHHRFGQPVMLDVRAGFTAADAQSEEETVLRQANMALREAQREQHLYHVYTPAGEFRVEEQRRLLEGLQAAVSHGELQLYYQPKINTTFRSLAGAEALMRWRTGDGVAIPPNQFIPVAESNAVIRPITWWAIKSAVARLARWTEDLSIAVNIAPQLLLDDEILAVVNDALEIHGVHPQRLVLEVTERIMVDNHQTMKLRLAHLQAMGTRISLDDFGTGFSSLAYFRDLPVDEIKIDCAFVRNMLECGKDHAIVKAVIDLAHNFSMKVVAEGVETQDIADRLKDLGCDMLQGYFFDRPLAVETFEASYGIGHPSLRGKQPLRDHPLM